MRLRDCDIDPDKLTIEISVDNKSPQILLISEGKARIAELPAHGEAIVTTHDNKVKRVKWDEGEQF
ncbi:hypothetical protein HCA78_11665 [Listeria booriae]|uniref:Uncharacterized protein n=1 Tax=Listeria booriae TaxID=1552123 RepID=A0A841W162_9LIST|nr:XtrA/YqaO family protein [Listeria booriae]MBC1209487.1 hypothetical protein [Listeria booriae]MBC1229793.1 hypothetical protein [Listeria booriae]MBC1233142.1 hypothetical protein [Listeria booriae]MBC1523580.1 hypothetical protein [Listeria booriae]MBC2004429.1 hypothetical protein [Listeria booriae]